jgi:hypothetical protein
MHYAAPPNGPCTVCASGLPGVKSPQRRAARRNVMRRTAAAPRTADVLSRQDRRPPATTNSLTWSRHHPRTQACGTAASALAVRPIRAASTHSGVAMGVPTSPAEHSRRRPTAPRRRHSLCRNGPLRPVAGKRPPRRRCTIHRGTDAPTLALTDGGRGPMTVERVDPEARAGVPDDSAGLSADPAGQPAWAHGRARGGADMGEGRVWGVGHGSMSRAGWVRLWSTPSPMREPMRSVPPWSTTRLCR